jgi:hypothetical protein
VRATIAVATLAGYAWWTAGVAPFTTLSYVLVAIPSLAIVIAYVALAGLSRHHDDLTAYFQRKSGGASLTDVAPWIGVLCVAVVLEVIGLLLGGHSPAVPTLSTTVDHLLDHHWERWLICTTWLLVGVVPLNGLRRSSQPGDS